MIATRVSRERDDDILVSVDIYDLIGWRITRLTFFTICADVCEDIRSALRDLFVSLGGLGWRQYNAAQIFGLGYA